MLFSFSFSSPTEGKDTSNARSTCVLPSCSGNLTPLAGATQEHASTCTHARTHARTHANTRTQTYARTDRQTDRQTDRHRHRHGHRLARPPRSNIHAIAHFEAQWGEEVDTCWRPRSEMSQYWSDTLSSFLLPITSFSTKLLPVPHPERLIY
jgi:hypothetical protein